MEKESGETKSASVEKWSPEHGEIPVPHWSGIFARGAAGCPGYCDLAMFFRDTNERMGGSVRSCGFD